MQWGASTFAMPNLWTDSLRCGGFRALLEEDSLVETDVPYRCWGGQARRGRDLAWLMAACERLPLSPEEKAEIFGGMELPVRWKLGSSKASRTLNKLPVRKV